MKIINIIFSLWLPVDYCQLLYDPFVQNITFKIKYEKIGLSYPRIDTFD
jgi:hypothetical protein